MSIQYKDGYKYQLESDYVYTLPDYFLPTWREIETDYLWYDGALTFIVKKGYAWDGPSGPTIDTKNFMRGSLLHDGLYQLIREGYLNKKTYRIVADKILYEACRQSGMSWIRANVVYYSVRVFGNPSALSTGARPLLIAP